MKGDKYPMILTEIQVSAIFQMRDIRRNDLPKFVWWLMDPISAFHLPSPKRVYADINFSFSSFFFRCLIIAVTERN